MFPLHDSAIILDKEEQAKFNAWSKMSHKKQLIQELKLHGIRHKDVLNAIKKVPREAFLPSELKYRAYDNTALPIDSQQTISQPYVVALMTQSLFEHPHPQKVLEIGTGSGYQAAILATLFKEVWTIERIELLYLKAKKVLTELKFHNIHFKLDDGTLGWPEAAPFDGIIVTAAIEIPPPALLSQLSPDGGIMVIPLGEYHQVQKLTIIERNQNEISQKVIELVSFVPLIATPRDP